MMKRLNLKQPKEVVLHPIFYSGTTTSNTPPHFRRLAAYMLEDKNPLNYNIKEVVNHQPAASCSSTSKVILSPSHCLGVNAFSFFNNQQMNKFSRIHLGLKPLLTYETKLLSIRSETRETDLFDSS